MRFFKRDIALLVMLGLVFSMTLLPTWATMKPPVLSIDGKLVNIPINGSAPYVDSSNVFMVPLGFVSEKLGATVTWRAESQTAIMNDSIHIAVGNKEIKTPIGVDSMEKKAIIRDNRMYVPVKDLASVLGYTIESKYSNGTVAVNINTKADLTVSAAASLKDALTELKALYVQSKPKTSLTLNFGSSGSLSQQIEQGAGVDLFFSAAAANMKTLEDKGLLLNKKTFNLLSNQIVLIAPLDSKLSAGSFNEVIKPSVKKIALGEPKTVPVGQYAEDVFTKLGILSQVKSKSVYGKDAREVLTWVEMGNVDAGVVYATDAKVSKKAKVIARAPKDSHRPLVYPVGIMKESNHPEAATAFLIFLKSDIAKAVFVKYGFNPL